MKTHHYILIVVNIVLFVTCAAIVFAYGVMNMDFQPRAVAAPSGNARCPVCGEVFTISYHRGQMAQMLREHRCPNCGQSHPEMVLNQYYQSPPSAETEPQPISPTEPSKGFRKKK
jgi:hypothetical protein